MNIKQIKLEEKFNILTNEILHHIHKLDFNTYGNKGQKYPKYVLNAIKTLKKYMDKERNKYLKEYKRLEKEN